MDVDFEQEVIANKMRSRVDTIVSNQQYAKRSSVSTTDALLQLTDDWTEVLDQDKPIKFVHNACLDFSKAFDRLQHEPTWYFAKMDNFDFNSNVKSEKLFI